MQSCCQKTVYLWKVSFQFSFIFPSEWKQPVGKMWIRCVETTAKTSAGINVEFDGTPTGFPLYICAKCEHIVQWVMMCTHTGCSLLWLVPFHFHQLRAVSAFAQVPFFFPFRKPPRCIHHFSLDAFAPFSSFLFGGFSHGARFCFCFPVSRLLSRPSLSSAGFSFRVLKKKKKNGWKELPPPRLLLQFDSERSRSPSHGEILLALAQTAWLFQWTRSL